LLLDGHVSLDGAARVGAGTVAIIEDEFLVALQIEDILLDHGYSVVATVSDFAGAAAIVQPTDVALVDLNLRDGLSGPRIACMLSERFGTRIIYVTASCAQIGEPAATALGVVHKPFTRASIEAVVAYALDDSLSVPRPPELQPLEGFELRQSA
jgi:DNA-binding response OmpR family regulator